MMSPVICIVPATDASLCVDLRIDFQILMGGPLAPEQESILRASNRAHLERGFADGSVLVLLARVDGELAGCVMLQEQTMIPNRPCPTGRIGLVLNLHVFDAFRRKGVAAALMRAIEAEGRRRGLDRLDLKASEMGEPLYRTLGWNDAPGGKAMELRLT